MVLFASRARRGLGPVMVAASITLVGCGGSMSNLDDSRGETTNSNTTISSPGETPESTLVVEVDGTGSSTIGGSQDGAGGDGEVTAGGAGGSIRTGADIAADSGLGQFSGMAVAAVVNHTSLIASGADTTHLVDALAEAEGVDLVAIMAPEHGFRGTGAAGEEIADTVDEATGVPVYSLYGPDKAPTATMLAGVDVIVFDLQDVGARYYTYISTMGLTMVEAAAAGVGFVVLDRPNPQPLGRPAGPMRADDQVSFVSQFPIPALHDLTVGELARAIAGEGWLPGLEELDLTVIPVEGWDGTGWSSTGRGWVAPSPGLPTVDSAVTYPAVVAFEATTLSFGRGTDHPFGQIGAPWLDADRVADDLNGRGLEGVRFVATSFTPRVSPVAPDPQFVDQTVPAVRLEVVDPARFDGPAAGVHLLEAVMDHHPGQTVIDRSAMFDLLWGTDRVRGGLAAGEGADAIVADWSDELDRFGELVAGYRLYP